MHKRLLREEEEEGRNVGSPSQPSCITSPPSGYQRVTRNTVPTAVIGSAALTVGVAIYAKGTVTLPVKAS